jgi:putative transposase
MEKYQRYETGQIERITNFGILKEREAGVAATELCRKHGISDTYICKWKAKFDAMDISEAKKLRGLQKESAMLKRLLADAILYNVTIKDFLEKKLLDPFPRGKLAHFSETTVR